MRKFLLLTLLTLTANFAFSQIIFSEDFQGGIPSTWTLINNDGLIPDPNVAQFTDAWIGAEDFDNPGDTVAMSTSWYSPPGQADDYLITPQINLTSNNLLSWEAEAQDANFPDGYEVRISTTTPTIGGFMANPALFTIAAESGAVYTSRSVDLQAAGYSNQAVYIAWRNNSTDQFILMVNNVEISASVNFDASIDYSGPALEYTSVPLSQATALGTEAEITNPGIMGVTNVSYTTNITLDGVTNVYNSTSSSAAALASGASTVLTDTGYVPTASGLYEVQLTSNITEVDGDQTNDTIIYFYLVSDSVYARDANTSDGTLGIGGGAFGELGQNFVLGAADELTSVSAFIGNQNGNMTNQPFWCNIYDVSGGTIGALLGRTDTITIDTSSNTFWNIPMSGGPLLITGDTFAVVAQELDSNITLGYSSQIFYPNITWVQFGANPWAPNEVYGFNVVYLLRANFGETGCNTTSSITATDCDSYDWAVDGNTYTSSGTYTFTTTNAAGCDSIIMLDLTINTATSSTETVTACETYTWSANSTAYTTSGSYPATLTNAAGCDSMLTLDLTISDAVDNNVTNNGGDLSADESNATYQWIDCDNGNAAINGETNQTFTPTESGNYAVVLTNGACVDTSDCIDYTVIGINNIEFGQLFDIYPNPSKGDFFVSVKEALDGNLSVKVLDLNGRLVFNQEQLVNEASVIEVKLGNVASGAYSLHISTDNAAFTQIINIQ